MEVCFSSFSGSSTKDYYSQIKNRAIFTLRKIQGSDTDKQIKSIDNYLLRLLRPSNYAGAKGLEVSMKKEFENLCTLISQHLNVSNPQKLSVFAFYSRLETLKKQLKPKK